MDKIKVDKARLQAALQDNKQKHEEEFKEANDAWKTQVQDALRDTLQAMEVDNDYSNLNPLAKFPKPQHHLKDYDLALQMLEFSVDDQIEIDQFQFNQYVMDEWNWKAGFAETASFYNSR